MINVVFFSSASPLEKTSPPIKTKEKTRSYRSRHLLLYCSPLACNDTQRRTKENRSKSSHVKELHLPRQYRKSQTPRQAIHPSITDNLSFARAPKTTRLPMFEPLFLAVFVVPFLPSRRGPPIVFFPRLPVIRALAISHMRAHENVQMLMCLQVFQNLCSLLLSSPTRHIVQSHNFARKL
ncbi:hypothetical protein LZ32DRAFT_450969 [Colletotrichum eremochloae]|nr:hypothetical protein LZ32DRAFT_450969 [Colletotrichum eremochloae]